MKPVLALLTFLLVAALPQTVSAQEYKEAYNAALASARAKNYEEAYTHFKTAAEGAEAAEDAETASRARRVMAQLDYNFGVAKTKAEDHEGALAHYEAGIADNPAYPHNYLGKGKTLREMDLSDSAAVVLQQAIEVARAANDSDIQGQSETALLNLIAEDGGLLLGKDATRASAQQAMARLTAADSLLATNVTAKLYLARAQTALGNYNEAVSAADAGIALDPRDRNEKAALYFAKGEALRLAGNTAGAKSAYALATYGDYKDLAQHYVDTL